MDNTIIIEQHKIGTLVLCCKGMVGGGSTPLGIYLYLNRVLMYALYVKLKRAALGLFGNILNSLQFKVLCYKKANKNLGECNGII